MPDIPLSAKRSASAAANASSAKSVSLLPDRPLKKCSCVPCIAHKSVSSVYYKKSGSINRKIRSARKDCTGRKPRPIPKKLRRIRPGTVLRTAADPVPGCFV